MINFVRSAASPQLLTPCFKSLVALCSLIIFTTHCLQAATVPPDFEDALVTGVIAPTALAFTPDNRLLITTQQGQVRVYQSGALLSNPALDLSSKICTNSERGVLGIAVDPEFNQNRYVYLYYTFNKTGTCNSTAVNRVARFRLADDNRLAAASEFVLIDNIHSPAGNHNGGDLHFGKDNLLYVSVGDGGCDYAGDSGCAGANDAARDRHVMLGKILRITRDGDIPTTNPYRGADSGRCNITGSTTPGNWCQETFASGLRNPFRIAFDPNASATRFFINDVGQGVWEEIDQGIAGADYGWNGREGHCPNNSTTGCSNAPTVTVGNQIFTNPIFDYQHTGNCSAAGVAGNSITGGAFVPAGVWSAEYNGAYLFGEFVCGKIFKLTPQTNGGYAASEFVTGLGGGSAVTLIFGPYENTKALYYTTYQNGGQVRRIRFTGTTPTTPRPETELKTWTLDGRTAGFVKLTFPDDSYEVADWGQATRTDNVIKVRATVRRVAGRVPVPISTAHIYDFGALPTGSYTFVFEATDLEPRTLTFTVSSEALPTNPIDDARTFARQHYLDFLSREPDAPGLDFWTSEITECQDANRRQPGETEAQCADRKRINTSGAFFLSQEFQVTGYYIYRLHKGALGRAPRYAEFVADVATVAAGIVANNQLVPEVIDGNKRNFAAAFAARPEFLKLYENLSDEAYVDRLSATTGIALTNDERAALIADLSATSGTIAARRAVVLFKIVDGTRSVQRGIDVEQIFETRYGRAFYDREFNPAFVLIQYFGYLRRDPDPEGYDFWLAKLNRFGNFRDAEMVKAFIVSAEYRSRFRQP